MEINVVAAVIAGLVGTAIITGMMLGGKQLKLPSVDAHGILGYIRQADQAGSLGYIMHFVLGAVFAIGYAIVFMIIPGNMLILGAGLGIIHWLVVGWMFAFAPFVHAGMKAGLIQETGPYMLKSLGITGFIAGLVGHMVFGMMGGLVYGLIVGNFGG
ncbi:MAG TPA: hypothetical protein VEC96_14065 [Anaerolineae bacterium]|nr:hypothetical protein [Anaerolineae bacterium]